MIYFCADDYGLNEISSERIRACIDKGALNKVSVFPNFTTPDLSKIPKNVRICLHLNLVEGRCMSDPSEIDLLATPDGKFRHTFGGLFLSSLIHGKKFREQACREIRAQVSYWKSIIPENAPFCVDSHQHTHMIPAVYKALLQTLENEKTKPEYIRIPAEPLLPYITTPSLYFTYSAVNVIKQWLLKFLWLINKGNGNVPTALFFGILFSGKMDEKRVGKILAKYIRIADKSGRDIEVLFHPGYLEKGEISPEDVEFEGFYLSENRKTEFNSVIKISERSVM